MNDESVIGGPIDSLPKSQGGVADKKDTTEVSVVSRWLKEIELAKKERESWMQDARDALRRYGERPTIRSEYGGWNDGARYNILYTNVSTLAPAYYGDSPKPQVERYFKDSDPVGRVAAMVLERAITTASKQFDINQKMLTAVQARLLPGCGQVWLRYLPHFERTPQNRYLVESESVTEDSAPAYIYEDDSSIFKGPQDDIQQDDDGRNFVPGEGEEQLVYEEVKVDNISYKDFFWSPAPAWESVRWVARRVHMTRDECIDRFGKKVGGKIQLTYSPSAIDPKDSNPERFMMFKQAEVYEIWNKSDRKVYWISAGYKEDALDTKYDLLGLEVFFPCPKPLLGATVEDSIVPIPDYEFYKAQAENLDTLAARIYWLEDACRAGGFYDGSIDQDLNRFWSEQMENKLVPIKDWAGFKGQGGVEGAIDWVPIEEIANVLQILVGQFADQKSKIDEVSGVADIMRGVSDPDETATAQAIKGGMSVNRIKPNQREVARFARDILSMTGEIIAKHFQDETISIMAGAALLPPENQQYFEPALQLLRDDELRTFRIDIETDSTISVDENAEKQTALEFMKVLSDSLKTMSEVTQGTPAYTAPMGQTILAVTRRFKFGRSLETSWEQAIDEHTKQIQQAASQPPPPSPEEVKAQAAQQLEQQKGQIQLQLAQTKGQTDMQMVQAKAQADMQIAQMKTQADAQSKQMQLQQEGQLSQAQMQQEMGLQQNKVQTEMQTAQTQNQLQAANDARDAQREDQLQRMKLQFEREKMAMEMQLEREKMQNQLKIEMMQARMDMVVEQAKLKGDLILGHHELKQKAESDKLASKQSKE